jgi:TatD DNase family protein
LTNDIHSSEKLINIHTHNLSSKNLQILSEDHQIFSQNSLSPNAGLIPRSLAFHPMQWKANDYIDFPVIEKMLQLPDVVAIGESGLDKNSPLPIQRQMDLFRQQMDLSVQYNKPIIIHCVGRWNELELLFKEKKAGSPSWIIHGFRKTKLIDKFLDLGAFLSFGEALLYDELLQKAVIEVPVERLFLETDGADVDILLIYEKLAMLKSLSLPAVIDQIYFNYIAIFHHGKLA